VRTLGGMMICVALAVAGLAVSGPSAATQQRIAALTCQGKMGDTQVSGRVEAALWAGTPVSDREAGQLGEALIASLETGAFPEMPGLTQFTGEVDRAGARTLLFEVYMPARGGGAGSLWALGARSTEEMVELKLQPGVIVLESPSGAALLLDCAPAGS